MSGYVYIIQLKEFVESNKNIYKIGRTNSEDYEFEGGSEIKLYMSCKNSVLLKRALHKVFKLNFNQCVEYGLDYFEGDIKLMTNQFFYLINKEASM